MVKRNILTQSERKILRRYIETGEEFPGLHSLLQGLHESRYMLTHDLEIIIDALTKMESQEH
jgi:hypothetical protein